MIFPSYRFVTGPVGQFVCERVLAHQALQSLHFFAIDEDHNGGQGGDFVLLRDLRMFVYLQLRDGCRGGELIGQPLDGAS